MNTKDFTTTIVVDQTPEQAFHAITNVRGWWSENIEGGTAKLDDVFDYHYEDAHTSRIKLIEVVPFTKVVWLLEDNYFSFTQDHSELTDSKVVFDIIPKDNKTQIRFTHQGLVPENECFDICSNAWTQYIQESLRNLIATGKGQPNGKGKPQTEDEKRLGK